LAYIKIGNGGSQRGSRNLRITTANGEPHTAQWQRQTVTRHHGEVNVSAVPWIDEGRAFTVWVATPFLLFGVV